MDLAIRTERLTKYYGSVPGVVDLDLDVPAGTVYGYLGTDGAGKTTTIRALLDLIHPTGGTAQLLGLDSHERSVEVRKRVGYLASDPAFYPEMTVRQHLRWLGKLRGGVGNDEIVAHTNRLGLPLDRRVGDLTRAGRQKLGLVQAFVHRPELLILDEPTAGLDEQAERTFAEMVREVAEDGRTVFFSSKRLAEVDLLCDWVGILRDARLVAVEEVAELRQRAMRRVTVRFRHPAPVDELRELAGVPDVSASRDLASFHVVGSIDHVVKALGAYELLDLTVAPADLEDVFRRFYDDVEPPGEPAGEPVEEQEGDEDVA